MIGFGLLPGRRPPATVSHVGLQNTTTDDFAVQLAARYLSFDVVGSGSELRIDGAVAAQPIIGAELPMLIGGSVDFRGAWRYYIGIGRLF